MLTIVFAVIFVLIILFIQIALCCEALFDGEWTITGITLTIAMDLYLIFLANFLFEKAIKIGIF